MFDLYWALTAQSAVPVDVDAIIAAFTRYMRDEGTHVPRDEFLAHLCSCISDKAGFCVDMVPLLKQELDYDPVQAAAVVELKLLSALPE